MDVNPRYRSLREGREGWMWVRAGRDSVLGMDWVP